ncbi:hypothetical protein NL676_000006 [Syzygium grande]|nr:hypothetical protein NL676_000006 [Syzygium grande]
MPREGGKAAPHWPSRRATSPAGDPSGRARPARSLASRLGGLARGDPRRPLSPGLSGEGRGRDDPRPAGPGREGPPGRPCPGRHLPDLGGATLARPKAPEQWSPRPHLPPRASPVALRTACRRTPRRPPDAWRTAPPRAAQLSAPRILLSVLRAPGRWGWRGGHRQWIRKTRRVEISGGGRGGGGRGGGGLGVGEAGVAEGGEGDEGTGGQEPLRGLKEDVGSVDELEGEGEARDGGGSGSDLQWFPGGGGGGSDPVLDRISRAGG